MEREKLISSGPEISKSLLQARGSHIAIKLFYAEMRKMREMKSNYIDIGSSIEVDPSERNHLKEIVNQAHAESLSKEHYFEYASSWGSLELRQSVSELFMRWGRVKIDPVSEVMVTRGINDSLGRIIRSLDFDYLIIPSWAPYIIRALAILNGKKTIDASLSLETGNFDLNLLKNRIISEQVNPGRVLMYVTHPSAPAGTVMEDIYIEKELIPFLRKNGIFLMSDSYITDTRFDGNKLRPLLSYHGAKDVMVEAVTVSKEIGLPGARAGGLSGNQKMINAVRILAATEVDIVSEAPQHLAAKAFREIDSSLVAKRISHELKKDILPRFQQMGWPVIEPKAGIDMLIAIPPRFINNDIEDPSLLASFTILRRYGIALCPASVYGEDGKYFLRIVLKQKNGKIPQALDSLKEKGFDWQTESPSIEDIFYLKNEMANLDLTRL